jgi:hypothetical protein
MNHAGIKVMAPLLHRYMGILPPQGVGKAEVSLPLAKATSCADPPRETSVVPVTPPLPSNPKYPRPKRAAPPPLGDSEICSQPVDV